MATKPFDIFTKHFSAPRVGTDIHLHHQVSLLYPDLSIAVTQDRRFDIHRYAKGVPDLTTIKETDDIPFMRLTQYKPPARRRDGDGSTLERVTFGGWDLTWRDTSFKLIAVSWIEPHMGSRTQWHILTADPSDAKKLIHACSAFCATPRNVIWVFERGSWRSESSLWEAVQKASWDDVVIDQELKRNIQQDYRSFFSAENIFKELGVPWKRGMILLGPPGNGKTISLKAIIKEADVPALYVKSFRAQGGDEEGIREIFDRARSEAPCVLVLEDLDSLITDKNRAFFLNEIGTTNHFDRLDPALSNRPSRFDRKYTFPNPSRADRRNYALYWRNKLRTKPHLEFPDTLLEEFADGTNDFSFAYMKEAFVSTLLVIASKQMDLASTSPFPTLLLEQVSLLQNQLATGGGGMASSWAAAKSSSGMQPGGAHFFRHMIVGDGGQIQVD
ncbi:hypothetical protein IAR55_001339 [Kwoniella newhampshirensis]|uniref:AAA+ ATPase domain-containing protein n=1 Tax=Kwoniella newhampshirensis TaxID=1651941 RepID=A0AAW0Z5E0_9TREE